MGQVHVQVILTNSPGRGAWHGLGQLDASQVHRYETEALIDTGAVQIRRFPLPWLTVLGLLRLRTHGCQIC